MRVVTVNTNYAGGGAAAVARTVHEQIRGRGDMDSRFLHSYGRSNADAGTIRIGSPRRKSMAALSYRLLSRAGWLLRSNTREYLAAVNGSGLAHLHNLHGYYLDEVAFLKGLTAPFVWTLHDSWILTGRCILAFDCERWRDSGCAACPDMRQLPATWLFDRAAEELALKREFVRDLLQRRQGCLVTPSYWLAERVRSLDLAEASVKVIPNPIDTSLFHPACSRGDLRQTLGLPKDKFLVLFSAARLGDRLKGAQYLEGLQRQLAGDSAIHFVCVGQAGAREGTPQTTHFGYVSSPAKLAQIYAACDVFVSTSLTENFPMCVLEAMSCGTPVVAFDVGGIREQLAGRAGLLVPRGQLADLTGAVRMMADDAALRRDCGLAGRSRVEELYSIDVVTGQYLEAYDKILTDAQPALRAA